MPDPSAPLTVVRPLVVTSSFVAMAIDRMVLVVVFFTLSINKTFNELGTVGKVFLVAACVALTVLKHMASPMRRWIVRFRLESVLVVLSLLSALGLFLCAVHKGIVLDIIGAALAFMSRTTEPAISEIIASGPAAADTLWRTRLKTISRRAGTGLGVLAAMIALLLRDDRALIVIYAIACVAYAALGMAVCVYDYTTKSTVEYGMLPSAVAAAAANAVPELITTNAEVDVLLLWLRRSAWANMFFETMVLGAAFWYTAEYYTLFGLAYFDALALIIVWGVPNRVGWAARKRQFTLALCAVLTVVSFVTCLTQLGTERIDGEPIPFHAVSTLCGLLGFGVIYVIYAYLADDGVTEFCRVATDPRWRQPCQGMELLAMKTHFSWLFFLQSSGEGAAFAFYAFVFPLGPKARLLSLLLAISLEVFFTYHTHSVEKKLEADNASPNAVSERALAEMSVWDYNGYKGKTSAASAADDDAQQQQQQKSSKLFSVDEEEDTPTTTTTDSTAAVASVSGAVAVDADAKVATAV